MKITSTIITICGHLLLAALAVLLLAVLSSCSSRSEQPENSGQIIIDDSLTGAGHQLPRDCVRVDSVKNW